jgi:hypothetical protein
MLLGQMTTMSSTKDARFSRESARAGGEPHCRGMRARSRVLATSGRRSASSCWTANVGSKRCAFRPGDRILDALFVLSRIGHGAGGSSTILEPISPSKVSNAISEPCLGRIEQRLHGKRLAGTAAFLQRVRLRARLHFHELVLEALPDVRPRQGVQVECSVRKRRQLVGRALGRPPRLASR